VWCSVEERGNGLAEARVGGATWPRCAAGRTGEGEGADHVTLQWAARGLPHAVPQKVGWAMSWRLTRYTWSPHAARARDGAVACSSAARWWLASGKVLGLSTTAERRMRRARGAEVGQSGGSPRWRVAAPSSEGGSAVSPASSVSYMGGCEG
jgi:hypothetical protein